MGVRTVIYWAPANFLALISELCFKFGTISTVRAGSVKLWRSFALTLAGAVVPVGTWKILLDFSFVKINRLLPSHNLMLRLNRRLSS